jgi:hypothetical protein
MISVSMLCGRLEASTGNQKYKNILRIPSTEKSRQALVSYNDANPVITSINNVHLII